MALLLALVKDYCYTMSEMYEDMYDEGLINEGTLVKLLNDLKVLYEEAERLHQDLGPVAPATPVYGNALPTAAQNAALDDEDDEDDAEFTHAEDEA